MAPMDFYCKCICKKKPTVNDFEKYFVEYHISLTFYEKLVINNSEIAAFKVLHSSSESAAAHIFDVNIWSENPIISICNQTIIHVIHNYRVVKFTVIYENLIKSFYKNDL